MRAFSPPTGPAREISIRVSEPPHWDWHFSKALSVSKVTALTTSRPMGRNAAREASRMPGTVAPPPMNTASGGVSPSKASGAAASISCRCGTPQAAAFRLIRAARSARRSMAMAFNETSASIHSIATDPDPAPTSQSSSPRRGASAERVKARISRLVIWPSCSNRSSQRPAVLGKMRAPGPAATSIATVFRESMRSRPKQSARDARMRSCGPASDSSTVSSDCPKPISHNNRASCAGACWSEVSARIRAPGCRCGRIRSSGRPQSESRTVCGSGHSRRDAAMLKADGAGTARVS